MSWSALARCATSATCSQSASLRSGYISSGFWARHLGCEQPEHGNKPQWGPLGGQKTKDMRRVLRPGGVIGVKDPDYATHLQEPSTPLTREALALYQRVSEHNGASPYYACHQRQLLREADFVHTEGYVIAVGGGQPNMMPMMFAISLKPWFQDPAFVNTAITQGWADQAKLNAMLEELRAWSEHPDAFFALLLCTAVGWVDGDTAAPGE